MFKLIKHRGFHDKYIKENTYEGIKLALESDEYIGVEFDVRETLDNEIILFYYPIYNNKLVSKTKYNELPRYVPKLKNILNIKSDKIFLIEIKNIKHMNIFLNIIGNFKNKNIYIMSFYLKYIKDINVIDRFYKIGILNYVLNTNNYIKELDFVCILNNLINEVIINELKGIQVISYGITNIKKYNNVIYIVDN